MVVLVLGGNGATGSLVVKQFLLNDVNVKTIIRNSAKLESLGNTDKLEIIQTSILEMDHAKLSGILDDVDAVVSCLGHNITIKGIFGKPRNLVFDAIRTICGIIKEKKNAKVKLILMSTTAYTNTFTGEKNSLGERIIFSILKLLLPPHRDNVKAGNYLHEEIGKENEKIEWIAVRPDALFNEEEVSNYTVHNSPVRSPVFNAGTTSRINVGNFIMRLLCDNEQWEKWKYQMPVIYNVVEN